MGSSMVLSGRSMVAMTGVDDPDADAEAGTDLQEMAGDTRACGCWRPKACARVLLARWTMARALAHPGMPKGAAALMRSRRHAHGHVAGVGCLPCQLPRLRILRRLRVQLLDVIVRVRVL